MKNGQRKIVEKHLKNTRAWESVTHLRDKYFSMREVDGTYSELATGQAEEEEGETQIKERFFTFLKRLP